MVASTLQRFFNAVYALLKMSLFFWGMAFAGVLVLGIGPALRVTSDQFVAHKFEYQFITWTESWYKFKQHFWLSNLWFWILAGVTFALGYNLYLSVQFRGWLWLFVDFIIIVALIFVVNVGFSALIIQSHFEISPQNLLKLAVLEFFHHLGQIVLMMLGLLALAWLTWKFKAMILFFTVPLMVVWADFVNQSWLRAINDSIVSDKPRS